MAAGQAFGLQPGHTSSIRRIEAAMLSYQADMTLANNPYELGMDRLVDLDMPADFLSKAALQRIKAEGVKQRFVGLVFDGPPIQGSNDEKWRLEIDGQDLGFVTSAVYSPRLEQNIALAMIRADRAADGTTGRVHLPDGARGFTLVPKPFYDPKKALAARS